VSLVDSDSKRVDSRAEFLSPFARLCVSPRRFHPRHHPRILRHRSQSDRSFRCRSQPTQHLPSPPFLPSRFRSSAQNSSRTLPNRSRQTLLDHRRPASTSSSGGCSPSTAAARTQFEVLARVGKSFELDEQ